MCERAFLWVGVDLLGRGSIAVNKAVPMNGCLTSLVSGMYAFVHDEFLVVSNKDNDLGYLQTPGLFHSVQCAYLKNGIESGTHLGPFRRNNKTLALHRSSRTHHMGVNSSPVHAQYNCL
jgi:hypothetical protein